MKAVVELEIMIDTDLGVLHIYGDGTVFQI
jgi:hypothetical protein